MAKFLGRHTELKLLRSFLKKRSASFLVIRGRRRVGKSRLIAEFGKEMPCFIFSGLPITKNTTKQAQLDEFAQQLSQLFELPQFILSDWTEAFWQLSKLTANGRVLLAFDEISWMGSKDPDFLGKLKNAWDLHFSKNPKLILVVCGSVSSWIQRNLLSNTGFLGRISLDLQLKELPLEDASLFWTHRTNGADLYEILKVLCVTGGIPRYLEEVLPELSAEENIRRMCFSSGGLLYREFDQIFSDLFSRRAPTYAAIVKRLAQGTCGLPEICEALHVQKSGAVSRYLKDLLHAGFVAEDPTWNLKTGKVSQLKKYRLSDNYLRFYTRYILPHKTEIAKDLFAPPSLTSLPAWETVMGLQFENLVINHIDRLFEALGVNRADVAMYGPYFQRKSQRRRGCQIDLLIQTRQRILYICEVKFSSREIGSRVIEQIDEKRSQLSVPRGWSTRTVLIHVNGVSPAVLESEQIDLVVDFSQVP